MMSEKDLMLSIIVTHLANKCCQLGGICCKFFLTCASACGFR